jgi:hypothetical protein
VGSGVVISAAVPAGEATALTKSKRAITAVAGDGPFETEELRLGYVITCVEVPATRRSGHSTGIIVDAGFMCSRKTQARSGVNARTWWSHRFVIVTAALAVFV